MCLEAEQHRKVLLSLIHTNSLSQPLVQELQAIFREEYGVLMPSEDAERAAAWLAAHFDGLANAAIMHDAHD